MQKSKLHNIFLEQGKNRFQDPRPILNNTEGSLIDCNGNFIALSWVGTKGNICILDPANPVRISEKVKLIKGAHEGFVSNVKFSPFRPNLLASCADDCLIKLWQIPEGGLVEDMSEEIQKFRGHMKRPFCTEFHPCCEEIIASTGHDRNVIVWNIQNAETLFSVATPEDNFGCVWSYNGALLGSSSRNHTYIIDPRTSSIVTTINSHTGIKPAKMNWISENFVTSFGCTKDNRREVKLFDLRKVTDGVVSEEVVQSYADTKAPFIWTFYDYSLKLLYLTGKGEGTYHIYDLSNDTMIPCNKLLSQSHLGLCQFPKKLMDYNRLEVMKFCTLEDKHLGFDSFIIPRKNKIYDPTLYPDILTFENCISVDDWKSGNNAQPTTKPIDTIENKFVSEPIKFEKKVEEKVLSPEEKLAEAQSQIYALQKEINELKRENLELKSKLAKQAAAPQPEPEAVAPQPEPETAAPQQEPDVAAAPEE